MAKKLKIEKVQKKSGWNLFRYEDDFLDKDLITGPQIQIFGNNKINIEGCYGVFEYTDTYLKLKLNGAYVNFIPDGYVEQHSKKKQ